ncbi:MAG: DUF2147 domain-containing protein [Cytophagales bacterium]|nr:MAG: DUF2147 domain-containing protein [Cytophagales bacterium]
MIKISFIVSFFVFTFGFSQTNSDKVIGTFWTPQKDGKIQIYKRKDLYYGKIFEGKNPRKDTLNPDKSLRNRPVIGLEFMYNFKFEDDIYEDGKIYDPESGKTYSCKMWLEGDNLKIRGFLGISLLGRTEFFERIK